jgi:hypothetical protein
MKWEIITRKAAWSVNITTKIPGHQVTAVRLFTTIKRVNNTEIDWACSTNWRDEISYTILLGKPEGKIPLWRPRSKWKNIKIYIIEIEYESMYWIQLAQDRGQCRALLNQVMSFQMLQRAKDFVTNSATVSFSKISDPWRQIGNRIEDAVSSRQRDSCFY